MAHKAVLRAIFCSVLFFCVLPLPSDCYKVGIIHGEFSTNISSLTGALSASGHFRSIGTFDAAYDIPQLTWMTQWDALFIFMDGPFYNDSANLVGDTVAQYIDQGGKVVTASYSIASSEGSFNQTVLGGRFMEDYQAIAVSADCYTTAGFTGEVQVGRILQPNNSAAQGWGNFSDMEQDRPSCKQLAPQAYVVAEWTDGTYLLVVRDGLGANGVSRVDIGFFPIFFVDVTQAVNLMVSSLLYTIQSFTGPSPPTTPSPSTTPHLSPSATTSLSSSTSPSASISPSASPSPSASAVPSSTNSSAGSNSSSASAITSLLATILVHLKA